MKLCGTNAKRLTCSYILALDGTNIISESRPKSNNHSLMLDLCAVHVGNSLGPEVKRAYSSICIYVLSMKYDHGWWDAARLELMQFGARIKFEM